MTETTLFRRQFLAGGLAVATGVTAGCSDNANGRDGSSEALEFTLTRNDGPLRQRYVSDLSETAPDWDEDAFEAALEGEAYTSQYRRPFPSSQEGPTYAERQGSYYRLDSVVVGEVTAVRPVLRLFEDEDATDTPSGSVAASELPPGDERAVHVAHLAARARGNEGGAPWGLVQRGGYVYRSDDAVQASEILADDGPTRVTYRETTYAVDISRETFHEPVYRATVESVAADPERMEAILRVQFVDARLTRDALSTAVRDVLETARADGYSETHPYSSGYEELLRKLDERAYLDGDVQRDSGVTEGGPRMLRYGDVYYDYRLRFA